MITRFRPLLSPPNSPADTPNFFKDIKFPQYLSPKVDGIRCLVQDDQCLSRTLKPIPSYQVQNEFAKPALCGLDGELVIGEPYAPGVYNLTQSHVMSRNKPGDLKFYVFDYIHDYNQYEPYHERKRMMELNVEAYKSPDVIVLEQKLAHNLDELLAYEEKQLELGYEGIMIRNPVAPYKMGRATYRENIIRKLKRFNDEEGVIVDILEGYLNDNPQERNELGYAKRSEHKANKRLSGMVGKFIVLYKGVEIEVAPGYFTHAQRKIIWEMKELYINRILKFRYFAYGVKDLPRFPRALGFRDAMDL